MDQTESSTPTSAPSNAVPIIVHTAPPPKGFFQSIRGVLGALVVIAIIFALGAYLGVLSTVTVMNGSPIKVSRTLMDPGDGKDCIVVIPLDGMTTSDMAGFVNNCVVDLIDHYKKDHVKAVVLRVSSPGGPVSPSDQMHHDLALLKKETGLPIIASYGSVAASGGYYISCMADYIIAEPTTITGSIGVIAQLMTFEDTLNKLGIEGQTRTASTSPDKDRANDLFRTWTDRDWQVVQPKLDAMHERFIGVVREGRSKSLDTEDKVKAVTTGLAFLGPEAKELGLVDEVGYYNDALTKASQMGSIVQKKPRVYWYQRKSSLFDKLVFGAEHKGPVVNLDPQALRDAMTEFSIPRMMYLYQP